MPNFEQLWDMGVGGAVAIYTIRELFRFLRNKQNSRNGRSDKSDKIAFSGEQPVDFWRIEFAKIIRESLKPHADARMVMDKSLIDSQRRIHENLSILVVEVQNQSRMLGRLLDRKE